MGKLVKCPNGHFYNGDLFPACPYCPAQAPAPEREPPAQADAPVSWEAGKTAPLQEDASGVGKTAPIRENAPDVGKTMPLQENKASSGGTGVGWNSWARKMLCLPIGPIPKKTRTIILGTLAAVLLLAAVLAGLTPIGRSGTTPDGFRYRIVNGYAVLTGYKGDVVPELPWSVQAFFRKYDVKEIGAEAFAGKRGEGSELYLPYRLSRIGDGAFRGWSDLEYITCDGIRPGPVVVSPTSFDGCDNLWVVLASEEGGWTTSTLEGVWVYYFSKGNSIGQRIWGYRVTEDGSMLYGQPSDDGWYVVEAVKPGTRTVEFPDTWLEDGRSIWFDAGALDYAAGVTVEMPDNCAYDYSLRDMAEWRAGEGTFADMWRLTCDGAEAINRERPASDQIRPDIGLVKAAMVRAEELTTLYDAARPDGRDWDTVITDQGLEYKYARGRRGHNYSSLNRILTVSVEDVAEYFAPAITESSSEKYAGEYCNLLGMAWAEESDGDYTWAGFELYN